MEPQIDYWSYSSMSALLSNPLNFKKKYILKVYDDPMSPSGVVGTACHKVAEAYFGNGKERAGSYRRAGLRLYRLYKPYRDRLR
jgi:hypothetical protein